MKQVINILLFAGVVIAINSCFTIPISTPTGEQPKLTSDTTKTVIVKTDKGVDLTPTLDSFGRVLDSAIKNVPKKETLKIITDSNANYKELYLEAMEQLQKSNDALMQLTEKFAEFKTLYKPSTTTTIEKTNTIHEKPQEQSQSFMPYIMTLIAAICGMIGVYKAKHK